MKKQVSQIFAALTTAVMLIAPSLSAASVSIVEAEIEGTQITAYVKGAGNVSSASAMVGQYAGEEVQVQTLSSSSIPIHTLVLIDNSHSIPTANRTQTKQMVQDLFAARKSNEAFSLGAIGEEVNILVDFTDDYTQLKTALDNMEYQKQDTFLTDALYDYFTATNFGQTSGVYERILLISDGEDDKSLGYTKDELLALLSTAAVPIYTVGISNGTSTSNAELENMFSLGRATGMPTAMLTDLSSLSSLMQGDQDITVVSLQIPAAAQDGSLQTLTLALETDGGSVIASADQMRMPLGEAESSEPTVITQETERVIVEQPIIQEVEKTNWTLYIIVGVLALVVIIVVVVVILLVVKTRKKKELFTRMDPEEEQRRREENEGTQYVDGTELTGPEGTLQMWQDAPTSKITLTDTSNLQRCYQKPITTSLVIGFSSDSDLCINYDKSVSRKHCEIVKEGNDFFIINHSQSNGTLLNGMKVVQKTPIYDGSVIKMGRVEMRVEIIQ